MKARHIFLTTVLAACCIAATLTSCEDFTDVQPKGKSMLGSTDDIELLFNQDMELRMTELGLIGGDFFYSYSPVVAGFYVENKSAFTLRLGFFDDENSINRLEGLATSDAYYSNCYSWIGTIANPALMQLESASGPEDKKLQLKSEALALRAFAHFMVLQKYAKAYNPATAANDPAIIYLKETDDIAVNQEKKSVQECYELALADINEALEIGGLPVVPANATRMNKAAGYAVKAFICMAMQKYDEAEQAAKQALAIRGDLYDYWGNRWTETNIYGGTYEISLISCLKNPEVYFPLPDLFYYMWLSPETQAYIEPGYAIYELAPLLSYSQINNPEPEDVGESQVGLAGWMSSDNMSDAYDNTCALTSPMMRILIAECELRAGNIDAAMGYLDEVRASRIDPDRYTPFQGSVSTKAEAIEKLKLVSFEENLWNGWNFIQRKRWNVEPEWETTLTRTIEGTTYTLSPKSNLWVFPFPQPVRNANPNMTSNRNQ